MRWAGHVANTGRGAVQTFLVGKPEGRDFKTRVGGQVILKLIFKQVGLGNGVD
jgi:hypothetical protein